LIPLRAQLPFKKKTEVLDDNEYGCAVASAALSEVAKDGVFDGLVISQPSIRRRRACEPDEYLLEQFRNSGDLVVFFR
jgi:hypothetical protein